MSVQQPVLSEKKRKGNIVNETDNPAGNLPDCTKIIDLNKSPPGLTPEGFHAAHIKL